MCHTSKGHETIRQRHNALAAPPKGKYSLKDLDEATAMKRMEISEVFGSDPGINEALLAAGISPSTLIKEVTSELEGDYMTPFEERLEFHNYICDEVLVIADVFRGEGLAAFFANDAIERQADLAEADLSELKLIIIKNIVNAETIAYLKEHTKKPKAFMSDTPLGRLAGRLVPDRTKVKTRVITEGTDLGNWVVGIRVTG